MNAAAQVSTTDSAFIHDSRPIIPFVVGKKDIEQQDRKWITNNLIPKLKALATAASSSVAPQHLQKVPSISILNSPTHARLP